VADRRLVTFFCAAKKKVTKEKGAPDSDSRSVEREGAQAAARSTIKWGAYAAAPAPQASLTVSRQPPVRCPFGVPCAARPSRRLRNSRYTLKQCSPTSPAWTALRGSSQGLVKQMRDEMPLPRLKRKFVPSCDQTSE